MLNCCELLFSAHNMRFWIKCCIAPPLIDTASWVRLYNKPPNAYGIGGLLSVYSGMYCRQYCAPYQSCLLLRLGALFEHAYQTAAEFYFRTLYQSFHFNFLKEIQNRTGNAFSFFKLLFKIALHPIKQPSV